MSLLINCQSLAKSFSSKELFSDLSLSISSGDRIGILGANGCGKSTLMKIIANELEADSGSVVARKNAKIVYVGQKLKFDSKVTIYGVLESAAKSAHIDEYELEGNINSIAGKIGFTDLQKKVSELSGGWKKRLEIATGLIADPEVLLLDEPTNHLDFEGILWLENLLKSSRFAWVVISHDREFLQNTVKMIAEISKKYPDGIMFSKGNYQNFLINRLDLLNSQSKLEETLANKARREIEWLRRGPKARSTKAKYRIDAAESLKQDLADVKERNKTNTAKIEFSQSGRKSKKLVTLDNISKSLGGKEIIKNFDFTLMSNMKIGILGSNGSGKTTLLKLIAKELNPDSGEVQHITGLATVYFEQSRDQLDQNQTLKRALSDSGDQVIYQGRSIHVISWAKRFLFTNDHLNQPISKLSGGEQAKVIIARLMLRPADLLLLDEPTNDLDIPTMEILEESLLEFSGATVLVSHDRYMLQKVCDLVIGLDGQGNATIFADYQQWAETLQSTKKNPNKQSSSKTGKPAHPQPKKKLSYKDQRDYDSIEGNIAQLEQEIEEKSAKAEDPEIMSNADQLEKAYKELSDAQSRLENLYARWEELEKLVNPS